MADKTLKALKKYFVKTEEETPEKFEDWTQIKRLTRFLWPRRGRIVITVSASIILSLTLLVPSLLTKHMLDASIPNKDVSGIYELCGLLLLSMLVAFGLEGWTFYEIQRVGQEAMRDLRMELFRHLQKQGLSFFDKKAVGWLVTRMTSDVNTLNQFFSDAVVGVFQQIFMLFGIFAILAVYNLKLALWAMVVIPLVTLLSWEFRRRIRVSYRLTRVRLSRLNTHVQENVTGMRVVQANTREPRQFQHFNALNDLHRDAHIDTVFAYAIYFPLIELVAAIGTAVIVWQGGKQFLEHTMTIGELFLFLVLLERFFAPIRDLSEKFNLVQQALAAAERLFSLLDTKPSIEEPAVPKALPAFDTAIEFKDVWFAYNEENWVLRGVSFRVERGQTAAIVGPTGSGKTTLMALLCRFYDIQKGQILIDGIDIRELKQEDLRRKVAIVMQDVFLFNGTVEKNIRLGEESISRQRIEEVATAVNASQFIERLPKGYETNVMERGATLSVGQKQLLSFARALAFDPQILILDEATSNIDTETERLIQDALERLCRDRTAMVIAHRLSTIQSADKIMVLHHGHLVEEGSHRELLEQDGLYRRLYELQYREQPAPTQAISAV